MHWAGSFPGCSLLVAIMGIAGLVCGDQALDDVDNQHSLAKAARERTLACHPQVSSFGNTVVQCQSGEWPSSSDQNIPPNVTSLHIVDVALPTSPSLIRPVQRLSQLTALNLKQIYTFQPDPDNASAVRRYPFPLQEFTRLLDRSKLKTLDFYYVFLGSLTEELFAGFPALDNIVLTGCDISVIDPRSFSSIGSPVFRTLMLLNNPNLVVFPWDSLAAVSSSIQRIIIDTNKRLATIDFSSSFPSTATMSLPKLVFAKISSNAALRSLPRKIVQTFPIKSPRGEEIEVEFRNNGNDCLDCNLVRPLIDWVRSGPTDEANYKSTGWLSFSAECQNATTTDSQTVGERWGRTGFWQNYTEPTTCLNRLLSSA